MALTFTGPYRVECRCVGCGEHFFSETFDWRDVARIMPSICTKCAKAPPPEVDPPVLTR